MKNFQTIQSILNKKNGDGKMATIKNFQTIQSILNYWTMNPDSPYHYIFPNYSVYFKQGSLIDRDINEATFPNYSVYFKPEQITVQQ